MMIAPETYSCGSKQCPHPGRIIFKGRPYAFSSRRPRKFYHPECEPTKQPKQIKPVKEISMSPVNQNKIERVAELLELIQEDAPLNRDEVRQIVNEMIEQREVGKRILVDVPGLPTYDAGEQHFLFEVLLYRMAAREDLYLYGPSGTGKTQAIINAAKALDLPFAILSLSPQSPPSRIEGFIDAHGRFTSPEFYKLYTSGGVMIFDELDFGGDNFMNTLNSAVSNGFASFPNGTAQRSPDFVLCGTGNTDMRGGNHLYPNRKQLCTSVVSRLRLIEWPPDIYLERSVADKIAGDKGVAWCKWIQAVRSFIHDPQSGVRGAVYADFRAIISGCKDIVRQPSWLTVESMSEELVFKHLPADQKSRILYANPAPKGLFNE